MTLAGWFAHWTHDRIEEHGNALARLDERTKLIAEHVARIEDTLDRVLKATSK